MQRKREAFRTRASVARAQQELPAPGHVVSRRELHTRGNRLLRFADITAQIPVADTDKNIDGELAIFGADGGRAAGEINRGDRQALNRAYRCLDLPPNAATRSDSTSRWRGCADTIGIGSFSEPRSS
jgi:hypothetical protein